MKPTAEDKEVLTDYLLGLVPQNDAERLDELTVCDDDYADALLAAECELVDSFVGGALEGRRLTAFHRHYLSSPLRRSKVEFATTLAESAAKAAESPALRPGFFERVFGGFGLGLRIGIAAAAAAIVVAGIWIAVPRNTIELATAVRSESGIGRAAAIEGRRAKDGSGVLPAPPDAEREKLAAGSERRERRESEPVRKAESDPVRRAVVATFVLAPPVRGSAPSLKIPKNATEVSLVLRLETDEYSELDAVVRDASTGRAVFERRRLSPRGAAPSIRLRVPARLLRPGSYTVEVSGRSVRSAPENIGDYSFLVVQ